MSLKNLIIKLGARGDVLRTTPLLYALNGDNYWVTREESIALLPTNKELIKQVVDINIAEAALQDMIFDLVLCLDDDLEAADLAGKINKRMIIGSELNPFNNLAYTDSSAAWFDMGLISKFSKKTADRLKINNKKTYQEIIFEMIGKKFNGEEYALNSKSNLIYKDRDRKIIGLEGRAGERWHSKKWNKYKQLGDLLNQDGFEVKVFQQKDTIQEYINDISECDVIVTGDTLALHIALALKIKVAAIFICTSPNEIFGYGRMFKIISPFLEKAFYRKEYIREAVEAVSLDDVYGAVKTMVEEKIGCSKVIP